MSTDSRLAAADRVVASSTIRVTTRSSFDSTVDVGALTVEVTDNSILGHLPTTGSELKQLVLTANSVTVDATSRIDASTKGFIGGFQADNPFGANGMTVGFQSGATDRSGASYGGEGGPNQGSPAPVYGDPQDPNDPGSGGGGIGGDGGGLIRIVTQTLTLDGLIVANGGTGTICCGGGGSGGGIRIDVGTIQGVGEIQANAGNGSVQGGGGGGGRVALYYEDATLFDLLKVTATGGFGVSAPSGQDGTVFLQQQVFTTSLIPETHLAFLNDSGSADKAFMSPRFHRTPAYPLDGRSSFDRPEFSELVTKIHNDLRDRKAMQSAGRGSEPLASLLKPNQNRYFALLVDKPQEHIDLDPVYTYDLNGNRTAMIDPTGLTVYSYDVLNRLTSITNPSGETTTFAYDVLGRRISLSHANGVNTSYIYDAASQLLSLTHVLGATTVNSFTYTYDKVGNRLSKTDNNGTADYTYDTLNRLVEAINPLPSNPLESFAYDEVGNRVDSNQNGLSTFNAGNQLDDDADFTYTYDANGNQIQKTNKITSLSTQFEYDAENQLIRVVREDASVVRYQYDGLRRRIEKDVAGFVTRYIFDNEDILLELDPSDNILARYTHGRDIDELLIVQRDVDVSGVFESDEQFFYHTDGLNSITELTDVTGAIVRRYVYDSYGNIVQEVGTLVNPFTYTSRELDVETGLYYFRARYYDSTNGTFTTEDPIGFEGALNFYAYVAANPINFIDPLGLTALRHTTSLAEGWKGVQDWIKGFQDRAISYRGDDSGHWKAISDRCRELKKNIGRLRESCPSSPEGQVLLGTLEAISKFCDNFPPFPPVPGSQPTPTTAPAAENNNNVTRNVAVGLGALGSGYLVYRAFRLLPSLLPPLWPTLPANAAIP